MWSVMAFLNRDEQAQLRISKTQAARVPRGTPGTSDIGLQLEAVNHSGMA